MTFDTPKNVKINNVVAATLRQHDPKDHAAAKMAIAAAAAQGQIAKDLMGSDAHQHTDTVVDNSFDGPFSPPSFSSTTSTSFKTPEQFMPLASIIASQP